MDFRIGGHGRHHNCDRDSDDCRTVINKDIEVKTPVSVDVKSRTGNVKILCARPRITASEIISSKRSSKCEFTINQKICVEIPICYQVRADVKDSYVECDIDCNVDLD